MIKIYLATPYTGTEAQQNVRFKQACEICAKLMKRGLNVFSPIAHSHNISIYGNTPVSYDFWKEQNASWLEWADELWIARMHRWDESKGIKFEIDWAVTHNLEIKIFTPGNMKSVKPYMTN